MATLGMIFVGLEVYLLPLVGIVLLITSKVSHSQIGKHAESFFLGVLLLATFATFRTMLGGETIWLMHAVTMAVLIVGAVSIPAAVVRCSDVRQSAQ